MTRRSKKTTRGRTSIYALILQDIDDNIFLVLHKDSDYFIGYLDDLSAVTREKGRDVTVNSSSLNEKLGKCGARAGAPSGSTTTSSTGRSPA